VEFLLRNYIRIHDWIHPRVMSRLGCAIYDGLHPKEVFGLRYKFFRDNVSSTDRVVDIACGTGSILGHISDCISYGVGVDLSNLQINLANRHNCRRNLDFYVGDIFEFDYSRVEFNVAILSHILEHIDDVVGFLKYIDVDKLLICVPSEEGWYSRLKWQLRLDTRTDASHYREYTKGGLRWHLEHAGYRVDYIGFNEDGNIICRAFNEKR